MDDFHEALEIMDSALYQYEALVPQPLKVKLLNSFVFRYKEQTIQQAIIQKLARTITGLKSANILHKSGFFQEQASIQRMLDEFEQDINFLSFAIINDDITDLHKRYLAAFYEEEFDKPEDPIASTQKRQMIPRNKIIAYISRAEEGASNPSRTVDVTKTINKTYSGYIHAASTQVMDLYGGIQPKFNVTGMLNTPHEITYSNDLWNYFYRGLMSFEMAAYVFQENSLADDVRAFRKKIEINAGKNYGP